MSRSSICISSELLRELLDLPDGIRITGFQQAHPFAPGPPTELIVGVESDHPMHDEYVTPTYRRTYDEGIARVELLEINGYTGPLEPRPSTTRKQRLSTSTLEA